MNILEKFEVHSRYRTYFVRNTTMTSGILPERFVQCYKSYHQKLPESWSESLGLQQLGSAI